MKLISNAKALTKLIIQLINKHEHVAFAFAWASSGTEVYNALIANKEKISKGVFGTHFYQTDPQVLDDFVESAKVRFIMQPSGVFHPKVIVFYTKSHWDVLIGSANLTKGAFTKNNELMLHVCSPQEKSLDSEIIEIIKSYFNKAEKITKDNAIKYRKLHEKMKSKLPALANEYGNKSFKAKPPINTKILPLSWGEYYSKVKKDKFHGTDARLRLLGEVFNSFSTIETFADMDIEIRKAIGGYDSQEIENAKWFGSMKGVGYFAQAINQNNIHISNALDFIPLYGAVTKKEYLAFIDEYKKAFPNGRHGIATASRLLAMKRPDYFVCLDSRNAKGICQDFGVARNGMSYERYWDELLQRIYNSVWWQSEMPNQEKELKVWKARAAMLDAIFYEE